MAALHRHSHAIWKALEKQAKPHNDFGEGNPVFVGKYVEVWDEANISRAYYSKVRTYLTENRYVEIIEQGSNNRDSIIVLWEEPPQDILIPPQNGNVKSEEERLTDDARFGILERRVEALTAWRDSLGGINLAEALRDIELRFARLEATASADNLETATNGSGESGAEKK